MFRSQTITDDSGQVRIVEHDDRGEPDFWTSQAANVRQWGAFAEAISVPMAREPSAGRGSFRIGTLFISAQVIGPVDTSGIDYVCLEAQVVGYVGAAGTIIKRMTFGGAATDDLVRFDDSSSFDRIAILAQQNVNGFPDGSIPCQVMTIQATSRFTR